MLRWVNRRIESFEILASLVITYTRSSSLTMKNNVPAFRLLNFFPSLVHTLAVTNNPSDAAIFVRKKFHPFCPCWCEDLSMQIRMCHAVLPKKFEYFVLLLYRRIVCGVTYPFHLVLFCYMYCKQHFILFLHLIVTVSLCERCLCDQEMWYLFPYCCIFYVLFFFTRLHQNLFWFFQSFKRKVR
jgi:hypothetical protein